MKTLYLECNMGAAGDMLLAALYELLDDQVGFLETMNTFLPDVRFAAVPASSCGVAGTHMEVTVNGLEEQSELLPGDGHADHAHRHRGPADIRALIAGFALPDEVKQNALAIYDSIAEAEAAVHGVPVGAVHFHEVGALDAVADVTGVCYALSLLAPDAVCVSTVHTGFGQVRCAHGLLPVPAPATAKLLTDAEVSERLEIARQEMEEDAPQYDMIIENPDGRLRETIDRVVEIVRKEGYNLGNHV